MAKITDQNGIEKGEASVIMAYYGKQPDQSTAAFLQEIKTLTPAAKTELAHGAAKSMGYSVV